MERNGHQIIAERKLQGEAHEYVVLIGLPFREVPANENESPYFVCPWWIEDENGVVAKKMNVGGEDSVQALVLALAMIGDVLSLAWEEPVIWIDGIPGSCFPNSRGEWIKTQGI
ncbi:MAG: hypothetical protein LBC29_02440 [Propionibacteriaceae bacterium]|nr:hypothetical protein [Propionibacteriaceae bacterium]